MKFKVTLVMTSCGEVEVEATDWGEAEAKGQEVVDATPKPSWFEYGSSEVYKIEAASSEV